MSQPSAALNLNASYEEKWQAYLLCITHTCASTRARSINVLLSAIKPLIAHPGKKYTC